MNLIFPSLLVNRGASSTNNRRRSVEIFKPPWTLSQRPRTSETKNLAFIKKVFGQPSDDQGWEYPKPFIFLYTNMAETGWDMKDIDRAIAVLLACTYQYKL